jgi:tetratricopeptide (TPR) repeat protein/tRNA A-37 threonylcarbamoyl transferase component Bud32
MSEEDKRREGAVAAVGVGTDATAPLVTEGTLADSARSAPRGPVESGPRRFAAAELVAERYRIVRLLGEGGMGEVYEADDLLLRERVALKAVHRDAAGHVKAVERFKREIQLARKVTHANVCRIFDVGLHKRGSEGEIAFLTMELLGGETLTQRLLGRGRMAPEEALPLVEQMAAALDAAHAEGIVHRDFKPSNVMLVPGRAGGPERAVVTDFGLARGCAADTDASVTGDGGVVGSPSYMAPEQVEGREITGAADIYAFGIVLYEMMTGKLPFVGPTPLATAVMRLREAPPRPTVHVASLDPAWERAILACLARDAAERPTSARAVADLISISRGGGRARVSAPRLRRTGWLWPGLVGAVLLVGAAAAYWALHPPARPPRSAAAAPAAAAADSTRRRSVAVLGFKNLTGRSDASWISGALAEMIATELAASTDVRTVPSESVARAKRELGVGDEVSFAPDTLTKLQSLLDTEYVLTGSYMALGKDAGAKIRFDLNLQDTRSGETIAVLSQTGTEAELGELVAATGQALRGKLALGQLSASEQEGVRASMPRGDILKLYAEGLAQLRVEACSAARGPLEQAVAADPSFPPAHSALSEALACLGYEERAKGEAERAVELSQHLPEHIRLDAQARVYELSREHDKLIDVYSKLYARFPDNFDYGYKLASAQLAQLHEGDFAKTVAQLRRLPPPAGNSPRIDLLEAENMAIGGKPAEALALAQGAEKRAEESGARLVAAAALMTQTMALNQLKRPEEAIASIGRARAVFEAAGDQDGVVQTLAAEASIRQGQGDSAFVKKAEDQVADIAGSLRNPRELLRFRFVMAARYLQQGNLDAAGRALDEAREMARSQHDDNLETASAMFLGLLALDRGDLAGARAVCDGLMRPGASDDTRAQALAMLAAIAHQAGDARAARARIDEAEALIKSPVGRAQASLARAQFANDEGDYKEGEKVARAALGASQVMASFATFELATALVGQKRWAEAKKALDGVGASPFLNLPSMELKLDELKARIQAQSDAAGARKALEADIDKASKLGLVLTAMELRIALGQIEIGHGDKADQAKGRARLAAVGDEARQAGLLLIERKTRRAE